MNGIPIQGNFGKIDSPASCDDSRIGVGRRVGLLVEGFLPADIAVCAWELAG